MRLEDHFSGHADCLSLTPFWTRPHLTKSIGVTDLLSRRCSKSVKRLDFTFIVLYSFEGVDKRAGTTQDYKLLLGKIFRLIQDTSKLKSNSRSVAICIGAFFTLWRTFSSFYTLSTS